MFSWAFYLVKHRYSLTLSSDVMVDCFRKGMGLLVDRILVSYILEKPSYFIKHYVMKTCGGVEYSSMGS
jgi:hypothetical protein